MNGIVIAPREGADEMQSYTFIGKGQQISEKKLFFNSGTYFCQQSLKVIHHVGFCEGEVVTLR